jgi:hypothetical protein
MEQGAAATLMFAKAGEGKQLGWILCQMDHPTLAIHIKGLLCQTMETIFMINRFLVNGRGRPELAMSAERNVLNAAESFHAKHVSLIRSFVYMYVINVGLNVFGFP